jgi:hypothetical protein
MNEMRTRSLKRRVRVRGTLDMIRFRTRVFGIMLAGGHHVRCVLLYGEMGLLNEFISKEILVEGTAVYRRSGQVRRIDVEAFMDGKGEPDIWSTIPPPLSRKLKLGSLRAKQRPGSGVSAFFGEWPGDETEEELLHAIRELDA